MRQRADTDHVNARKRIVAERFETHAAGNFHQGAAGNQRHRGLHLRGRHVVEQDHVRLRAQRFTHFREGLRLHFDP